MRTFVRTLTLLSGIITTCMVYTVCPIRIWAQAGDTLDPLPSWAYPELGVEIIGLFRYDGWAHHSAADKALMMKGKLVPSSIRGGRSMVHRARTSNEKLRILAWSATRVEYQTFTSDDPTKVRSDEFRQALVWVRLNDPWGKEQWALAVAFASKPIMEPDSAKDQWQIPELHTYWESRPTAKGWRLRRRVIDSSDTVDMRSHEIQRRGLWLFDHPPTNADIYAFMSSYLNKDAQRLNWPRYFMLDRMIIEGGRYTILDADVRENTWQALTGEPPAIFFPNGK